MKIRTDFVTNSSSDSYAEVLIDNLVLLEILQIYKDMGVFGDADTPFEIGCNPDVLDHIGEYLDHIETKTPAFHIFEDISQGESIIGGSPESLDDVLAYIIAIMEHHYYLPYYDPELFEQMKEELKQMEAEIRDGYVTVQWIFAYNSRDFEPGDEYRWEFTYNPENGEKYSIEYKDGEDEEDHDEDENSDEEN